VNYCDVIAISILVYSSPAVFWIVMLIFWDPPVALRVALTLPFVFVTLSDLSENPPLIFASYQLITVCGSSVLFNERLFVDEEMICEPG